MALSFVPYSAAASDDPGGAAAPSSNPPPDLSMTDLSGSPSRLSDLRGDVVVLNFWATWCKPCLDEMPALARVHQDFAPRGVRVVGASADAVENRKAVERFVRRERIRFPVWLGASTDQMERFGLEPVLPGTVVLDRQGRIAARYDGVFPDGDLRKTLDRLLAGAGAQTPLDEPAPEPPHDHAAEGGHDHDHAEATNRRARSASGGGRSASKVPS